MISKIVLKILVEGISEDPIVTRGQQLSLKHLLELLSFLAEEPWLLFVERLLVGVQLVEPQLVAPQRRQPGLVDPPLNLLVDERPRLVDNVERLQEPLKLLVVFLSEPPEQDEALPDPTGQRNGPVTVTGSVTA